MKKITLFCPQTIKGMIAALAKKYPGAYISIEKKYRLYQHHDDTEPIEIEYQLYVEGHINHMDMSYEDLKIAVAMDINKKRTNETGNKKENS